MATVAPWHHVAGDRSYHLRDDCPEWKERYGPHEEGMGETEWLCEHCFLLLAAEIKDNRRIQR